MIETVARPEDPSPDRLTPRARLVDLVARHRVWAAIVGAIVVGLPLLVAVGVLSSRPWHPVLDLAMTEFRVRDAFGRNTPLIGLPGRIGEYPNQGSHPGPLSFYLIAPTYRLFGASAWGMEAGTVVVHLVAIGTGLWLAARQLGAAGLAAGAALFALVIHGYGQVALTQPWNPYLPLVAWVVVQLAAWAVVAGDPVALVPLVAAASFCAQTHVPYLLLGVGMVVVGLVAAVLQARRAEPVARRRTRRLAGVAVAVGALLWLPPVADQLADDPGNIRQLVDHFGSPPEEAIGVADGVEIALRHLDAWTGIAGQVVGGGGFVDDGSVVLGALTLAVWIAAAVSASRIGSRRLRALHVVVAAAVVLGTFSAIRIFGRPWYYLTLWMWGTTMLAVGAVAWTAVTLLIRQLSAPAALPAPSELTVDGSARRDRVVALAGGAVALVVTLVSTVSFAAGAEHPEERLSDAVGALAGPTYDAVVAGAGVAVGGDGRYQVRWSDAADIGSPGFGLLDELERRGLDVYADEYFRVQVTDHRAGPRDLADAQIHLATGGYIDRWRAVPDAVEVATYDPRSDAERADYADVRAAFVARLTAEGLDELVPLVDTNLFGISVDVRLSPADHADLARLIELGQPMAVFVAPAPADDDAGAL